MYVILYLLVIIHIWQNQHTII